MGGSRGAVDGAFLGSDGIRAAALAKSGGFEERPREGMGVGRAGEYAVESVEVAHVTGPRGRNNCVVG
jgi:hypothetical protein